MRFLVWEIKRQTQMSIGGIRALNDAVLELQKRMVKVEGNRKFKEIKEVQDAKTQDEITEILSHSTKTFHPNQEAML